MIEEAYIGKDKMYFVDGKMYRTREEAMTADTGSKSSPKSSSRSEKVRNTVVKTAKSFAKGVQEKAPGAMLATGNFLFPYSSYPSTGYGSSCPTCGESYTSKRYCKNCDEKPKTAKEKKAEMTSRDIAYERYTAGYRNPQENYDRMADQILERYDRYGRY
jgi:hypothetical protein